MSFRFTNNLVGVLRHRLQLEAAHRSLARRTFVGVCNGVQVTCTGYGTVMGIQLIDKATWESYYRPSAASTSSSPSTASEAAPADEEEAAKTPATAAAGVDLFRLSSSIRAATWEAIQKIRAAKEEAHHRALTHNSQLASAGELRHWYNEDAISMAPRFDNGLTTVLATPWMQAMRFGVSPKAVEPGDKTTQAGGSAGRGPVVALSAEDCTPDAIRIGSVHPLFTPALLQLEAATAPAGGTIPNGSCLDDAAIIREQKKEMARDERQFWERVELIRRGQLATIPGGMKRQYADQASTVKSDVEDKVELHFTR